MYDGGVYIHSLVARTCFCSTVCLRTSAHLHACHTHAWLKVMKKVFVACVSMFSVSLSPFSCFTRLCCSLTVTSRPFLTLTSTTFLPSFTCPKSAGQAHSRTSSEKHGYLAKSALNTGYEPKKFDKITSTDNDTMLIDDPDLNEISLTSRKSHMRTLDCSVFSQFLNPLFRTFLMMILLFK